MVAKLNIERQEFNEITMAREYSYLIGDLLRDKLGKLLVQSKKYYLTPSDNTIYTINLSVFSIEDGTQEDITVSYTSGTSESIETILDGLSQAVVDNSNDQLVLNAYTDYTSDTDKHFFIIPKQGYRSQEVSLVNITTEVKPEWTESDVPASYVGYGKQPTSTLPRIVITPIFQETVCDRMEESVMLVDDVETEYTSSYINYSLNITCEAGSTDEVMRSGVSSQSILNTFRKMMVNEIIKNRVQNEMKSVCYPMTRIINAPAVAQTQYMDTSSAVMDFSCVDIYFPETGAGFIDAVEITMNTEDIVSTLSGYIPTVQVNLDIDIVNPVIITEDVEEPVEPEPIILYGSGGVQIGDIIIHSEDVWHNENDEPIFDLITITDGLTVDESTHPELYSIYTSVPSMPNATGSEVPYKVVADYTGE